MTKTDFEKMSDYDLTEALKQAYDADRKEEYHAARSAAVERGWTVYRGKRL